MPLTPEQLYLRLGQLVKEMPPDLRSGPITSEMHRWMGLACTLVENVDKMAAITLRSACQNLDSAVRQMNAQTISVIVHEALAKAELEAPAPMQGAFIAAGNTLAAYAVVERVLGLAKNNVLMVDPYADVKIVTEYAVLAPENVVVRILTDAASRKPTLKPAADKWSQQFGQTRAPLEVRLAPAGSLHDRLIILDGATVYTLGQSFNKLAERAHTSSVRVDDETGAEKITAYLTMWQAATPL
jgi:hypothetical protein